jgi:hypothetical protein
MPDSGRSVCGSDVCIDIEATICLVMRARRDDSWMIDVSDGELVTSMLFEAVFRSGKALLLLR